MNKLFIVSNRLPVTVARRGSNLKLQSSVGGLAAGLDSFHKSYQSLWIGWPGYTPAKAEREKMVIRKKLLTMNCHPVFLTPYDVENFYYGMCNKTIWPLFHYFTQYTVYDDTFWKSYVRVNEQFCKEIVKLANPQDEIWIHDYQLMLLPKILREKIPEATIGFFLHIPFPSSEVFRLLPYRTEIIEGILGADLIGFHTHDYVHHFTQTVRRLLGFEYSLGKISAGNRTIKADAFPMGIDYERYHRAVNDIHIQKELRKLKKKMANRKIILSVDRLDYTKGIQERLEAFDIFLERYPKYRKKVTLVLVAVPSRTRVSHYASLKRRVDELISRINGKYGDIGWMPIWYLYRFLNFQKLVPLYIIADVALTTPLRDGMNLIAKEFIASKVDKRGVLILSEMAGATQELGEALTVNPNNKEEIAEAIKQALTMSEKEQKRRNEIMQQRLRRYNVERWANDFMDRLHDIKRIQRHVCMRELSEDIKKRLLHDFSESKHRLFLLDYDGTLVSFAKDPEDARPDTDIFRVLKNISSDSRNEVVIVSGRQRNTLDKWFNGLDIGLIAEHGVWTKMKKGKWRIVESLDNEWKEQIRPTLERYVDRTPGSFIEEKEFSLVWHYRRADPKLTAIRASELTATLLDLTSNLDVGILEGSKVIEIKNKRINKGRAALRWILKKRTSFILAIGDDWTDEDVFAVLPPTAYSIRVGYTVSKASFCLENPSEVRELLKVISTYENK